MEEKPQHKRAEEAIDKLRKQSKDADSATRRKVEERIETHLKPKLRH